MSTQKATILVADDSSVVRRMAEEILTGAGYQVILVDDGMKAVSTAFQEKPDLVILDIEMPKMDGYSVCQTLRKTFQHMPIIMLTSKDGFFDRTKGKLSGANEYIVKPFESQNILSAVERNLPKS